MTPPPQPLICPSRSKSTRAPGDLCSVGPRRPRRSSEWRPQLHRYSVVPYSTAGCRSIPRSEAAGPGPFPIQQGPRLHGPLCSFGRTRVYLERAAQKLRSERLRFAQPSLYSCPATSGMLFRQSWARPRYGRRCGLWAAIKRQPFAGGRSDQRRGVQRREHVGSGHLRRGARDSAIFFWWWTITASSRSGARTN